MVFKKMTWSMTALALGFQMIVAAATLSILTFHPGILGAFEEESSNGTPIEVSCQVVKDIYDVDWDVRDRS